MQTIISNLKKEITIPFNKKDVESRMKYLCKSSEYYKSYDDSESILGLYKYNFKKPIRGIVSLGMQVQVTLHEVEDKTKVVIEVIDNWGGTDEFDIDNSNILINEVTKSLTNILQNDTNILDSLNIELSKELNKKDGCIKRFFLGFGKAFLIGFIAFVVISILVAIFS